MNDDKCPRINLQLNGSRVSHIIDTGTNLNIISKSTLNTLKPTPNLKSTHIKAYGFNADLPVPILGEFNIKIKFRDKSHELVYVVLNGEADNLLGYASAKAMDIITIKINRVETKSFNPISMFPTIFEDRVGKLKGVKVHFEANPNVRPHQSPPYTVPFALERLTQLKLEYLIKNDIIEVVPFDTPVTWISAMNPRPKFDKVTGELVDVRITQNYAPLNKALYDVKRYIPSMKELAYALNGMEWFSLTDIKESFFTVELDEPTKALTVFCDKDRLYRMKRLCMGLSIAPEIFQSLMAEKLAGLKNLKQIHDDALTYGRTEEEAKESLLALLKRYEEIGVTINKKSVFIQQSVKFFGMVISKDGIRPNEEKMTDFLDTVPPKKMKDLHSLLGIAAYFANRIPYSAIIAKPLRLMLRQKRLKEWTHEQLEALKSLKEGIIFKFLSHFDPELETNLIVDAGPMGIGIFLTQFHKDNENDMRLNHCGSHCFTESECNYSHLEKEMYACVWGAEHEHIYVYGIVFWISSDSSSAIKIFEEKKPRKNIPIRLQRFKAKMALYNAKFRHIPGNKNIADFVSRHMAKRSDSYEHTSTERYNINRIREHNDTEEEIRRLITENCPDNVTLEEVEEETDKDKVLVLLREYIRTGNPIEHLSELKHFNGIMDEIWMNERGVVLRNQQIILPVSLHARAVTNAHEGHLGMSLTKRLLRSKVWFASMDTAVEAAVNDCLACQANTDTTQHELGIISQLPKDKTALVSLDFSSKTPTGEYLLIAKYERGRYPAIAMTRGLTARDAIRAATLIFERHGFPEHVKSDNGPAFIAGEFKQFLHRFKIKHIKITPLHPEANGGAEKIMNSINKCIRCAEVEGY